MAHGKAKRTLLGIQGVIGHRTAPDWGFIYNVSTEKNPNYNIGDVVELPNGKGFVYCKSGGACYTGQGNAIYNAIPATGIDYALLAAAAAIGDTSVKMTAVLTHTVDDLRGGTILLKIATGSSNAELQCRGIIGNTAAAPAGTVTIYLDAPLTSALTGASYGYCMPSPYSDIRLPSEGTDTGWLAFVGPAAAYVSATGKYFWCQFKGRVMGLAPSGIGGVTKLGNTQDIREIVWRQDGSVQAREPDSGIDGENGQVAGYIVDNNGLGNGATEYMLTGHV